VGLAKAMIEPTAEHVRLESDMCTKAKMNQLGARGTMTSGLLAWEKVRIQHGNVARRFSSPVSSQIHDG
jgi:hypothetical protein